MSRLEPLVVTAYGDVAGENQPITMRYEAHWRDVGLAQALAGVRADELRRGVTLVGPHRDDLAVQLNDLPSRTHSSQGEQRSLALALRLAGHRLVTESVGTAPVLLLDDVFSELDPERSTALPRWPASSRPPSRSCRAQRVCPKVCMWTRCCRWRRGRWSRSLGRTGDRPVVSGP